MKTLDELKALQRQLIDETSGKTVRILVGMATCGISAGAKPVLAALEKAVAETGLDGVEVSQTGCIGVCRLEPMFEILDPWFGRTTYVDMTPEKAIEVVRAHLLERHIIEGYTITAYD